jgi:hypothetical protein
MFDKKSYLKNRILFWLVETSKKHPELKQYGFMYCSLSDSMKLHNDTVCSEILYRFIYISQLHKKFPKILE